MLSEVGVMSPDKKRTLAETKIKRWKQGRIKPVTYELNRESGATEGRPQAMLAMPPVGTVVDHAEFNQCIAGFDSNTGDKSRVLVAASGFLRENLLEARLQDSGWREDVCLDEEGNPCGALLIEVVEVVAATSAGVPREFNVCTKVTSPREFDNAIVPCVAFFGWEAGTLTAAPSPKRMKVIRITLK